MSLAHESLYQLLPAIYRIRDAEQGQPLLALLEVVASQARLLEEDIAGLYENWFIETCQDWVVPYLAELVGYRRVRGAGEPGPPDTPEGRRLNKALIPRREIANTIRLRGRKGTLAALEQLAYDVTGWTARAVETYERVARLTQVGQAWPGTAQINDAASLSRLATPFDTLARTVDVRSAAAGDGPSPSNLHGVRLHVWRLRAYSVTKSQPGQPDRRNARRYTFSAIGQELPLFIRPEPEAAPSAIAGELNTPSPLRRQTLVEHRAGLYGPNGSFCLYWQRDDHSPPEPVPPGRIVVADLSGAGWNYRPLPDQADLDLVDWERRPQPPGGAIAVDPELGRILLPPEPGPRLAYVSYHYGFSADIGGGEYHRKLAPAGKGALRISSQMPKPERAIHPSMDDAIAAYHARAQPGHLETIEFIDSAVYRAGRKQKATITVPRNCRLELRAVDHCRPAIDLSDAGDWIVRGEQGSVIVLDGLLIHSGKLLIEGRPSRVEIRHTTIVPGSARLQFRLDASRDHTLCEVTIASSILGQIWDLEPPPRAIPPGAERRGQRLKLTIEDSIVDARRTGTSVARGHRHQKADEALLLHALLGIDDGAKANPGALERLGIALYGPSRIQLSVARSTLLGSVRVERIRHMENTICAGWIAATVADGAIQFSAAQVAGGASTGAGLRPAFCSERYGDPRYCRLAPGSPPEIARGAKDSSEMGVYHDLFLPQREAMLRARLDEYTVASMEAALCFAD